MDWVLVYPTLLIGLFVIGGLLLYILLDRRRTRERTQQSRCVRCGKKLDGLGYDIPVDAIPSDTVVTMCPKCTGIIRRLYLWIYRFAILCAIVFGASFMLFIIDHLRSGIRISLGDLDTAFSGLFGSLLISFLSKRTLDGIHKSKR